MPWQWTTLSVLCHSTDWGAASICQTHCVPKLLVSTEIEFSIYVLHASPNVVIAVRARKMWWEGRIGYMRKNVSGKTQRIDH